MHCAASGRKASCRLASCSGRGAACGRCEGASGPRATGENSGLPCRKGVTADGWRAVDGRAAVDVAWWPSAFRTGSPPQECTIRARVNRIACRLHCSHQLRLLSELPCQTAWMRVRARAHPTHRSHPLLALSQGPLPAASVPGPAQRPLSVGQIALPPSASVIPTAPAGPHPGRAALMQATHWKPRPVCGMGARLETGDRALRERASERERERGSPPTLLFVCYGGRNGAVRGGKSLRFQRKGFLGEEETLRYFCTRVGARPPRGRRAPSTRHRIRSKVHVPQCRDKAALSSESSST